MLNENLGGWRKELFLEQLKNERLRKMRMRMRMKWTPDLRTRLG